MKDLLEAYKIQLRITEEKLAMDGYAYDETRAYFMGKAEALKQIVSDLERVINAECRCH